MNLRLGEVIGKLDLILERQTEIHARVTAIETWKNKLWSVTAALSVVSGLVGSYGRPMLESFATSIRIGGH